VAKRFRSPFFAAFSLFVAGLGWLTSVATQAFPQQAPPPPAAVAAAAKGAMAEQVFKDVRVLKGIPADEFLDTMGMFASALLFDCVSCHAKEIITDENAFALETPRIQRARQMVVMMNTINRLYFGGQQRVTCYTCHGGGNMPRSEPNLDVQYGEPIEDPYAIAFVQSVATPPAAEIFARYMKAIGGAESAAKFTSFVGVGTYTGFDSNDVPVPAEVFVKAPNQMATVAQNQAGINAKVFDGKQGWRMQQDTPIPLLAMTGDNLQGAAIEAMVWFPASLQKSFSQWQTNVATINGTNVTAVQGSNPGQLPIRLYFDEESGMLVRLLHWRRTAVGAIPTRVDFEDFRPVAGVQMPFMWTRTWTNNQVVMQMKDIRPNAPVDPARFAQPQVTR
jgi:outer membrane lipoprotein-sorting protein